jgi:hypothetical protein
MIITHLSIILKTNFEIHAVFLFFLFLTGFHAKNIGYPDIFATNPALYSAISANGQQIPLDFISASG